MIPTEVRRIEVARRLVGKAGSGAVDKCPGDRHPLLFATRELAWIAVALVAQTDEFKHLAHLRADDTFGAAPAPRERRQRSPPLSYWAGA